MQTEYNKLKKGDLWIKTENGGGDRAENRKPMTQSTIPKTQGRGRSDAEETERDPPGATAHAGPTKRGPYCS